MTPVVVVSPDELRALVREQVEAALATQREADAAPLLLDRRQMARALSVGVDTLDRLRREGCPEITVGDMPRFDIASVIAWLRDRERGAIR